MRRASLVGLQILLPSICWIIGAHSVGATAAQVQRKSDRVSLVSVSSSGEAANAGGVLSSVSADGRYVAFASTSTNLDPRKVNSVHDIFVHDLATGTTELVSVAMVDRGCLFPSISGDGRFVAFQFNNVYVYDRQSGTTEVVGVSHSGGNPNDFCYDGTISGDGRFVAFTSQATNLVGDEGYQRADVFVRDRVNGLNERVSVSELGGWPDQDSEQPVISWNGRFVAFVSRASNIVQSDTNGVMDVFVRDRLSGTNERVSVSSLGVEANGAPANMDPAPAISSDGRFVAYVSAASNLVPNDNNGVDDVFVRDRLLGKTWRVSVTASGAEANGVSKEPVISGYGRFVAFTTTATNIIPGDTNGAADVLVRDRLNRVTWPVFPNSLGSCGRPAISADGSTLAFDGVVAPPDEQVYALRQAPLARR